jgi:hypothetical protein
MIRMNAPSSDEFRKGYMAFQQHERRDAMYKTATFLVDHFWGRPADIADSLGVLLLTWNQAFYRYGPFDFQRLEKIIAANQPLLDSFRSRHIVTYSAADDAAIRSIFGEFMAALQICEGSKKATCSPVAVAKALHLLAPRFFPLWDLKIANAYGCRYSADPAATYLRFLVKIRGLAGAMGNVHIEGTSKTVVKLIDEYNYARFTKGWI